MLGFVQYGSRLFGIDASSDPTKFQDDWPSGNYPLIGAWSLVFVPNECTRMSSCPTCQVEIFRQKLELNDFGPVGPLHASIPNKSGPH